MLLLQLKKTFKKYNEAFGGGYDINEDSYFSESQAYFMLAQERNSFVMIWILL